MGQDGNHKWNRQIATDIKNASAFNNRFACPLVLRPESKIQRRQGVRIARTQLTRHVTGKPFSPEQAHFLDVAATERTLVSRFCDGTKWRFDLVNFLKDLLFCNVS